MSGILSANRFLCSGESNVATFLEVRSADGTKQLVNIAFIVKANLDSAGSQLDLLVTDVPSGNQPFQRVTIAGQEAKSTYDLLVHHGR
jgi:hypothetical protein